MAFGIPGDIAKQISDFRALLVEIRDLLRDVRDTLNDQTQAIDQLREQMAANR